MNRLRSQYSSRDWSRAIRATFAQNWKPFATFVSLLTAFGAGYGVRAQGESDWIPAPPSPVFALFHTSEGPRLARNSDVNSGAKNGDRLAERAPLNANTTARFTSSTRSAAKVDVKPYQTLDEVRRAIHDNFVHPTISDEELTYGAIRGMLSSLGDRFTRFMTPAEYRDFKEKNEGDFIGVGARIDLKDDYVGGPQARPLNASRPYIVEAIDGSPAQRGGLAAGDVILAVDGRSTADKSADSVVADIKGVRGTNVTLKIERKIKNAPMNRDSIYKVFDLTLKRDTIIDHPVKLEWLPQNIAWLRLTEFNERSDEEVTNALVQVKRGNNGNAARGLVFDLRDNPGGLLNSAVSIGSRFIAQGPIVSTRERDGKVIPMNADRRRFLNLQIPVVVMVNNYSASAAEIVTGALKDRHAATVVGEQSYGKASVQVLIEIRNGGALVITTAKYLTPLGRDISDKGVAPDVVVKANAADNLTGRGVQLGRAIAIIRQKTESNGTIAVAPLKVRS